MGTLKWMTGGRLLGICLGVHVAFMNKAYKARATANLAGRGALTEHPLDSWGEFAALLRSGTRLLVPAPWYHEELLRALNASLKRAPDPAKAAVLGLLADGAAVESVGNGRGLREACDGMGRSETGGPIRLLLFAWAVFVEDLCEAGDVTQAEALSVQVFETVPSAFTFPLGKSEAFYRRLSFITAIALSRIEQHFQRQRQRGSPLDNDVAGEGVGRMACSGLVGGDEGADGG